MPVAHHIDHDVKAAVLVASGEASDGELRSARAQGLPPPPGYGELIDLRAATRFRVAQESMFRLARRETVTRPVPTRIAIVSPESEREGTDQPFELVSGLLTYSLSRERPRSEIRIFRDITEARAWLAPGPDVTNRQTTRMPSIDTLSGRAVTTLEHVVEAFAEAIVAADALRPQAVNARTKQPFQPGIGPHTEAQTVGLVAQQMARLHPEQYIGRLEVEVGYPDTPRSKCDFCVGTAPHWDWAIEVKMARFLGDNGKPNDNILLHILSPYPTHRSALSDCEKLLESGFPGRKAILIYGFDHDGWPLDPAVNAFEQLAATRVELADRITAGFDGLVHPVHRRGRVFAWELQQSAR